jgi:hypothetical protein
MPCSVLPLSRPLIGRLDAENGAHEGGLTHANAPPLFVQLAA